MFSSSVPRGTSRSIPKHSTRPNLFNKTQSPIPTTQQPSFPQSAKSATFSNDPFPDPARNLFADAHHRPDEELDPFTSQIDLTDELSLSRPLDAVKFCLNHVRIDQLDPELFNRLKQRAFTVPHAVEQLVKDDRYFKCLLEQLYMALETKTGIDVRAALSDFKSEAALSQTCVDELADLIVIYSVYRAGSLPDVNVPASVVSRLQEVIEIVFRTPRCGLLPLVQECRDGIARSQNSGLLTGFDLHDSPGQLFMINAETRPRFIHIMNTCVSLYLTANTALLVDIPLLISRLVVGETVQSHILKQSVIGGYLERAEDWLARRRPIKQDLQSACTMIGKLQDFPGDNALITDSLKHALHPVFSETLRLVIRQNGVPRNLLTWDDFESLMSSAQLQHDADPDEVFQAVALQQEKAAIQIQRPANQIQPLAVQIQPRLPAASARKQVEDIIVDTSKLPSPPESFPKTIQEAFDVAVACRDCAARFSFTVSEQDFYIKTMKEPNFPVRCGPCRLAKKLRNGDPVSQQPPAPPANLAIADPDVPCDDSWDEIIRAEEDYSFCNL